ncbi:hypothetical protein K3495_g2530 [Podosphaera aphanis]|nr:hypothetical protein K3495_g2530 [Podosphaera aphanis]
MSTELIELVGFISHGNTQIRQIAVENLIPYSLSQPAIFKINQLLPIRDLILLVRDYKQIAHSALIILINLSTDQQILEFLISNDEFLNTLLRRIVGHDEHNANEISMLLANLGKHDKFKFILSAKPSTLKVEENIVDQLLDLFVKGPGGDINSTSSYDYLSYLFADLAKHEEGRNHFLSRQSYDQVIPLSKLVVFTSHKSHVRRQGVAMTIKNVCFETSQHRLMLEDENNGIGLLPYLLLPLMGGEEYDADDSEGMLEECQLLPSSKQREDDMDILKTHLESLMLLTTTRSSRDRLREIKVYPIVRELHLAVSNEEVRDLCDRLVQVLMRDEEDEGVSGTTYAPESNYGKLEEGVKEQQSTTVESRFTPNQHQERVDSDDDEKLEEV